MKNLSVILFLTFTFFSQEVKSQKVMVSKSKNEMDVLYEKYQSLNSIVLYTDNGDLTGSVLIKKNNLDKPVSITIYGRTSERQAIQSLLDSTVKMKKGQGYITAETSPYDIRYNTITSSGGGYHLLMKKGSMYFFFNAKIDHPGYSWEMETGDSSRKGGSKTTKFTF